MGWGGSDTPEGGSVGADAGRSPGPVVGGLPGSGNQRRLPSGVLGLSGRPKGRHKEHGVGRGAATSGTGLLRQRGEGRQDMGGGVSPGSNRHGGAL